MAISLIEDIPIYYSTNYTIVGFALAVSGSILLVLSSSSYIVYQKEYEIAYQDYEERFGEAESVLVPCQNYPDSGYVDCGFSKPIFDPLNPYRMIIWELGAGLILITGLVVVVISRVMGKVRASSLDNTKL